MDNGRMHVGVYLTDDWLCRVKKRRIKDLLRIFLEERLGNSVAFATALPGENGFFGTFEPDNLNALEAVRICVENNISFLTVCSLLSPEIVQLLQSEYGDLFVGSQALNETTTSLGSNWQAMAPRLRALHARHPDGFEPRFSPCPEPVRCDDYKQAHDAFVRWLKTMVADERARGIKTVCSVEAHPAHGLMYKAGVDLEGVETMVFPVDPALASIRGAARAYGKDQFIAFPATGWYGGSGLDPEKPKRLKLALYYAYIYGATHIYNESDFFLPTRKLPKRFDDPLCVKCRKAIRSFYRFTQKERRPQGFPTTRIAFAQGYLDSWCGASKPFEDILWGQERFRTGTAEKSWDLLDVVFPNYSSFDRLRKGWFGGTPYGQVDLVPIDSPGDIGADYSLLVFLGWNTMTSAIWRKLLRFARRGGCLFMALPHAFTRKKYHTPGRRFLFRRGDYSDLFGLKITGIDFSDPCEEMGLAMARNPLQAITVLKGAKYDFARGKHYYVEADTREINIRLAGAEVIARGNTCAAPVLTRKAFPGGGEAFFLVSPDYPIIYREFFTDILKKMVARHQGDVRIAGGDDVNLSVYPDEDGRRAYLLNTNLRSTVDCVLECGGRDTPISLKPGQLKVVCCEGEACRRTSHRRRGR